MATTYCDYIKGLKPGEQHLHKLYHDTQYGFPIASDDELFGRLILEINQAGLSWTTILNKQENFRKAFDNFSIEKIAAYNHDDINRLLQDAGIIRNKLKVSAVIYNAQMVLQLQKEYDSFNGFLQHYHPLEKNDWVKLFKKYFRFTGGEIVNEFLMSTGYLPGAHTQNCEMYHKVLKLKPMWALPFSNSKQ